MSKLKQSEIAVVLGVSEARVTQLKAKGMPTGSIDVAADWYRKNIDQKLSPKITPSIAPPAAKDSMTAVRDGDYDILYARAKREHHEANLAELKERQALGELVEASKVRHVVTAWAALARSAFERIPDKLSERLAAETDAAACHALIVLEVDMVLADLAAGARGLKFESDDGRS